MEKLLKVISNRAVIIVLLILLQLGVLFAIVFRFQNYFVYFYTFYLLISSFVVIKIINSRSNPAYKIAWIIPIMLIPVFGTVIYLVFGRVRFSKKEKTKMEVIQEREQLANERTVPKAKITDGNQNAIIQSNYLSKYGESSLFTHTTSEYYPLGEQAFEAMIEDLKKAEKYIFMEFFIVNDGEMWQTILDIMIKKAREGVDVRFIYDDFGCLFTLPHGYDKKLRKEGIKCCVFNPFIPVLSPIFNNRNHRKITVIDGKIAYTGGINLADEYINAIERFGHWKDNSIKLVGEAAWGFSLLFLSMWDFVNSTESRVEEFIPIYEANELPETKGYYQPYVDSPFDRETVGMNVYLNLINRATDYVYFTTPYLVIDNLLMEALCNAAKGGVDVRIITPHIPDKWYVHAVTKSNYAQLIEAGVEIYEYTPGFIHSKTCVVDGEYATVGTVNLDYRSLFLHFECGVWMYKTKGVDDVLQDHLETEKLSQLITLEEAKNVSFPKKVLQACLSVFAPLL
ncbi:cardiolipin synthase [Vagococcus sp. CY52-2]|uniref:cardiolipin synthase n=1 Tax=Vagococcus sp. CY52-2 TaxID=2925838 RepID=UPI001F58F24B|nr:cardiolipin synthase [Vagococcus sp. CY52-2]UNM88791.1 cardiolipin synthase [Vagococcus sp. CY52-2]